MSSDVELRARRERVKEVVLGQRSEDVRVGRFTLEARIGAGGMGAVYSAYDPQLERSIALKLLRDDLPQARLLAEARTLARLSHPNVVPVHEVGRHDDRFFVVMEKIDGQSLARWLHESTRTWKDVLRVFVDAGRGVSAAHDVGIVHRDFKPDNVLVDKGGHVRVVDFGLARSDAATQDLCVTSSGTPRYLAPEIVRGESASAASDQYAYCLATVEALFGADARVDVAAPRAVRRALERGLSDDPTARWPSMKALLQSLERALVIRPSLWPLAAAGGLVAVVAGATIHDQQRCDSGPGRVAQAWVGDRSGETGAALEAYAQRWIATDRVVCLANDANPSVRATACLDRSLRTFGRVTELLAADQRPDEAKARSVKQLPAVEDCTVHGRDEAEEIDTEVERQLAEANAVGITGRLLEAVQIFDAAVQRARASGRRLSLAHALLEAAFVRVFLERPDEALALHEEGFWLAHEAGFHAEASRAAAMLGIATTGHDADHGRAALWARLSRAAASHDDVPDSVRIFSLGKQAWVSHSAGRLTEGLSLCDEAIALMEQTPNPPLLDAFEIRARRARILVKLGRPDDAAAYLETLRPLAVLTFGVGHPNLAFFDGSLGEALYASKRYADAEQAFRRAYDNVEAGYLRQFRADCAMQIGLALAAQGRVAEALPLARKAFADAETAYDPSAAGELAWAYASVAEVELAAGEHTNAQASIRQALDRYDQVPSPKPTDLVRALGLFARAHGDNAEAAQPVLRRGEAVVASQPEEIRPMLLRALRTGP